MSARARLLLGLLVVDLVLILFCRHQQAELRGLRSLRARLETEIEVAALARRARIAEAREQRLVWVIPETACPETAIRAPNLDQPATGSRPMSLDISLSLPSSAQAAALSVERTAVAGAPAADLADVGGRAALCTRRGRGVPRRLREPE